MKLRSGVKPPPAYQNVGWVGYFQRYGLRYGLSRMLYLSNPFLPTRNFKQRKQYYCSHIAKKVRKKYCLDAAATSSRITPVAPPSEYRDVVWVAWHDGFAAAPDLVRICRASLTSHLGGRRLIELTKDNISDYLEIPGSILVAVSEGRMPLAAFYDIVRYALLGFYGGTWIDATVLLADGFTEDVLAKDFFAVRAWDGGAAEFANWLLRSSKPSPVFLRACNILVAYWAKERYLCEYLLAYIALTLAVELSGDAERLRSHCQLAGPDEELLQNLHAKYDAHRFAQLLDASSYHKLSYKLPSATLADETNIYHHMLREFGSASRQSVNDV